MSNRAPAARERARSLVAGLDGRATNVGLLLLVVLATASGALAFATGAGWAGVVTATHGVVGLGLLVLTWWKQAIARRGLRRRPAGATWPSVLLAVLVTVVVVSGVLRSTGLVLTWGPLDDMQVHVGAALLSLPLVLWHVVDRGSVPTRQDLTRRNALRSVLVLGSAGAVWGGVEAVVAATGLPGRDRRATGSFEVATDDPDAMPATIWLFDRTPTITPAAWACAVTSATTRTLTLDDLAALPTRTTRAVLDCTGGWWSAQDWHGVALADLVGAVPSGTRSVRVVSATGYARRFPLRDLEHLVLATAYADRPLAGRHGGPARLVAPGRRGFWWVKWVTAVDVDDVPWWRQSPYPLT